MSGEDRIAEVLIGRDPQKIHVIDVGWSQSRRFNGQTQSLHLALERHHIGFHTPKRSPRSGIDTNAFMGAAKSYIHTLPNESQLIYLISPAFRGWKEIRDIIINWSSNESRILVAILSKGEIWNIDAALTKIADAILYSDPSHRESEGRSVGDGFCLGRLIRSRLGYTDPCVVVIGGNERQKNAREKFPTEVNDKFGIRGHWIFTDYKRPERVTEEIKKLCEAELRNGKLQIVAAAFMQRFNATNAKRNGMKELRDRGVFVSAPEFKSLESAIVRIRNMLRKLVTHS